MSYSQMLIAGPDGELAMYEEYKNSHGFLSLIWDVLCRKYEWQIAESQGKSSYSMDAWPKLWKWMSTDPQPKMQPWEMNVLVMSYDRAYTKGKRNLLWYADSLERFSDALVPPTGRVNHLKQMGIDLRTAVEEEGAEYVAWYGMSVAENLFWVSIPQLDEDGEEEDGWDSDESHLLSFLNEEDMKKIGPSEYHMVPPDGPPVTCNDTSKEQP